MTPPVTTTYAALAEKQAELIRKPLEGSIFIAAESATVPTAITSGANAELLPLPTGYSDIGWVDKGDGATWTRSVDTSEVESWGAAEPTRVDLTKEATGLKFVAQETKRATLELYEGVDLSTVVPNATTGEVTFDKPAQPQVRYYRVFGLFVDGAGADTIYVAKLLPRANVTDKDDKKWAGGDDPDNYGITLNASYDATIGTSMRCFYGGPGWRSLLTAMGFTA